MQCVTYSEQQDLADIIELDRNSRTMLTEFFEYYSKNKTATKYLYREFPEHYVWDRSGRVWRPRKKGNVYGRVNGANPIEGERYYLRMLLNHVPGPSSYDDLLTFNGKKCLTFKAGAQERGLLESDNSSSECLNEAVAFKMPHALRRLFATPLIYCEPTDVRTLWHNFFDYLSEDFRRNGEFSEQSILCNTLKSLNFFLESMGKSIEQYDLPSMPAQVKDDPEDMPKEILDEMSIGISLEDYMAESNLNPEQEVAFTTIVQRANSGNGGLFFIEGPGGSGKTFLYRALLAHFQSKKMIAIATATSGVAASILPGGRTAHSRFKIPIIVDETSLCNFTKQSGTAKLQRKAKLISWDEAPMAKRVSIETVDRTLQDIMDNKNESFGGKIVVFGGDFMQVLPVVRRGSKEETINASIARSYLWSKMEIFRLTRNMRAKDDPEFGEFILRVGRGEEPADKDDMIRLPEKIIIKYDNDEASENRLIDTIFPCLQKNAHIGDYMAERAILATMNENVDTINQRMIDMFPGASTIYKSFDEAEDDTNNYYQEEFLNMLAPQGLPPHKLELKKNCPIMLLRNLDPANGLCNGTRLVCKGFQDNVIHAEITVGQHKGNHVFIPRIPLAVAEDQGYPFKFKRKQFPMRLCFAMTINKAQGQTIPHVGVYLPQSVFSHGQLYVALSRGTSMLNTKILVKSEIPKQPNDTYTKNIVYKEILQAKRNIEVEQRIMEENEISDSSFQGSCGDYDEYFDAIENR